MVSIYYALCWCTQLFRCEWENVRWGFFIKGQKNQDENIGFSIQTGPCGINRVSDSVQKNLHWRERARLQSLELRGDFPAMAFLAFRACFLRRFPFLSRFPGKDFLLCVQVLGLQFPKGFSRLHFVRAIFLQQGFSAFPSARFQHISFSKVPACFLPARFCVCVCVLVLRCPWGFFRAGFPAYFLWARFFSFCVVLRFPWSFWGPAFPAYFLQHFPPTRFSVSEVELRLLCSWWKEVLYLCVLTCVFVIEAGCGGSGRVTASRVMGWLSKPWRGFFFPIPSCGRFFISFISSWEKEGEDMWSQIVNQLHKQIVTYNLENARVERPITTLWNSTHPK